MWVWNYSHLSGSAKRSQKIAKDANPLEPSRRSIQSILGHFWNFATTGFWDLTWFLSQKSVFMPKAVFNGLKTQNASLECCLEWKNTHLFQVWGNFLHNCGLKLFAANTRGIYKVENAKIHNCEQNCAKLGVNVNVYFFIPSNILSYHFGIWGL